MTSGLCNPEWSTLEKLRWKALQTKTEAQLLHVEFEVFPVTPADSDRPARPTFTEPLFAITANGATIATGDLHECWLHLSGLATGAVLARHPAEHQLPTLNLSPLHPEDFDK